MPFAEQPILIEPINQNLKEYKSLANLSSIGSDPLKLAGNANARAYFPGVHAENHKTLALNLSGAFSDKPSLIPPDAGSQGPWLGGVESVGVRMAIEPLAAGDLVKLGTLNPGQAGFFPFKDGVNSVQSKRLSTAYKRLNSDRIQHRSSFASQGSSYALLSFEDSIGVGYRDFNDLVFAVDFGTLNVQELAKPEPSLWPAFAVLAGAALTVRLRHRRESLSDWIASLIRRLDARDTDQFFAREVADIQNYETPIDEHEPGEERA